MSVVRWRLDLGYDGSAFSGWARQPGFRTVQAEVESALVTVLRLDGPPAMTVAGRTDAGVHARGQVVHVDIPRDHTMHLDSMTGGADGARRDLDEIVRRLNGVLPPDVRVKAVLIAPPGFDARFSALSRRYSYRVADGWLAPVRRHDTLAHRDPLDLAAMNEAAALLLGEHNFAAFCRRREGATTIRTLLALHWTRDVDGVAVARVEADAFCHSMVRALVGALLAVGDGRRPTDWPAVLLAGQARDSRAAVAAPHGLTLEEVCYPPADHLQARADQTRQRRDGGQLRS